MKEFTIYFGWLRVANFDIIESALSFWLAFMLKISLLSITIPRILSTVTFSIVLSVRGKYLNGSLKSTVRKWYFSVLIIL